MKEGRRYLSEIFLILVEGSEEISTLLGPALLFLSVERKTDGILRSGHRRGKKEVAGRNGGRHISIHKILHQGGAIAVFGQ